MVGWASSNGRDGVADSDEEALAYLVSLSRDRKRAIGLVALAIGVALVLSTWIGLVAAALTLQALMRLTRGYEPDDASPGGRS
mgnify:CR=1 FL=1